MQQIHDLGLQNRDNGYQKIGKWYKYFGNLNCSVCPTVASEYQSCPNLSCRRLRFPFLDLFDATSVCMQNLYNGYSTEDVYKGFCPSCPAVSNNRRCTQCGCIRRPRLVPVSESFRTPQSFASQLQMVSVQNNRNGYQLAPMQVENDWNASPQLDFTLIYRGRASCTHCTSVTLENDKCRACGARRPPFLVPTDQARLAQQNRANGYDDQGVYKGCCPACSTVRDENAVCFQCSTVRLPFLVALKQEPDGQGGYRACAVRRLPTLPDLPELSLVRPPLASAPRPSDDSELPHAEDVRSFRVIKLPSIDATSTLCPAAVLDGTPPRGLGGQPGRTPPPPAGAQAPPTASDGAGAAPRGGGGVGGGDGGGGSVAGDCVGDGGKAASAAGDLGGVGSDERCCTAGGEVGGGGGDCPDRPGCLGAPPCDEEDAGGGGGCASSGEAPADLDGGPTGSASAKLKGGDGPGQICAGRNDERDWELPCGGGGGGDGEGEGGGGWEESAVPECGEGAAGESKAARRSRRQNRMRRPRRPSRAIATPNSQSAESADGGSDGEWVLGGGVRGEGSGSELGAGGSTRSLAVAVAAVGTP
jgi:hypothetical protein